MVRSLLTRTMEAERYQVYVAGDGIEALMLLEKVPPVDLVISDVSMPRMDGRELAMEMSKRHPHVPLLLISGVYLGGVAGLPGPVLPKPFTRTALVSRVREVLSQSQHLGSPAENHSIAPSSSCGSGDSGSGAGGGTVAAT